MGDEHREAVGQDLLNDGDVVAAREGDLRRDTRVRIILDTLRAPPDDLLVLGQDLAHMRPMYRYLRGTQHRLMTEELLVGGPERIINSYNRDGVRTVVVRFADGNNDGWLHVPRNYVVPVSSLPEGLTVDWDNGRQVLLVPDEEQDGEPAAADDGPGPVPPVEAGDFIHINEEFRGGGLEIYLDDWGEFIARPYHFVRRVQHHNFWFGGERHDRQEIIVLAEGWVPRQLGWEQGWWRPLTAEESRGLVVPDNYHTYRDTFVVEYSLRTTGCPQGRGDFLARILRHTIRNLDNESLRAIYGDTRQADGMSHYTYGPSTPARYFPRDDRNILEALARNLRVTMIEGNRNLDRSLEQGHTFEV